MSIALLQHDMKVTDSSAADYTCTYEQYLLIILIFAGRADSANILLTKKNVEAPFRPMIE